MDGPGADGADIRLHPGSQQARLRAPSRRVVRWRSMVIWTLVAAGMLFDVVTSFAGGRSPVAAPADRSWRVGVHLMDTRLYRSTDTGVDIGAACRAAVLAAKRRSADLDFYRAVDGCRYEEWRLDN